MINNGESLDDVVKEDYKTKSSPYNGIYNKTSLFLLPMLGLNVRNPKILKYMNNSYIDDKGIEHAYIRPIFILFNVPNILDRNWIEFEHLLKRKKEFVYDYYIGKREKYHLVMLVFETLPQFAEDYYNFKVGKFSQFSKKYKESFPRIVKNALGKDVESTAWGIINKSAERRQYMIDEFILDKDFVDNLDEWGDSPKKEEEYYRYSKDNNDGN